MDREKSKTEQSLSVDAPELRIPVPRGPLPIPPPQPAKKTVEITIDGQAMSTILMLELTGARLVEGTVDVGGPGPEAKKIRLRDEKVTRLLGTEVPLGEQLYGYVGFSFFRFRDHGWPAVSISFAIDGVALGSHSHLPESGWQRFEFATPQFRASAHEVQMEISGVESRELELCFYAATR